MSYVRVAVHHDQPSWSVHLESNRTEWRGSIGPSHRSRESARPEHVVILEPTRSLAVEEPRATWPDRLRRLERGGRRLRVVDLGSDAVWFRGLVIEVPRSVEVDGSRSVAEPFTDPSPSGPLGRPPRVVPYEIALAACAGLVRPRGVLGVEFRNRTRVDRVVARRGALDVARTLASRVDPTVVREWLIVGSTELSDALLHDGAASRTLVPSPAELDGWSADEWCAIGGAIAARFPGTLPVVQPAWPVRWLKLSVAARLGRVGVGGMILLSLAMGVHGRVRAQHAGARAGSIRQDLERLRWERATLESAGLRAESVAGAMAANGADR